MDDKNVLLNQLRIDRTADVESDGTSRRWVLIGASVVLVVGLAAGAYWFLTKPSGIPVADAVAKEAPGGSVSGGGKSMGASMLDASGYVVARRSATVASKSILRVVDVLIEEGQRVKEGEVIARLDDSNTRAALQQAQAQVTQAGRTSRPRRPRSTTPRRSSAVTSVSSKRKSSANRRWTPLGRPSTRRTRTTTCARAGSRSRART
jgi:HlyD family secretion protein